jgi:hypothetical protein
MKTLIKDSVKVLTSYLLAFLVFSIFLIVVISMTRTTESLYFWLPIYSFVNFLILFLAIYSDIKRLATIEKRPQYDLKPYPLKGLVIGIIGFLPVVLIEVIYPLIHIEDLVFKRIAHAALNTVMGPLYFIIRLGGGTTMSYVLASMVVPVLSMLSYMAGYYNIDMGKLFRRKKKQPPKSAPVQGRK